MSTRLNIHLRALALAFVTASAIAVPAHANMPNNGDCWSDDEADRAMKIAFSKLRPVETKVPAPGNAAQRECVDLMTLPPYPACNIGGVRKRFEDLAKRNSCAVPGALDAELSKATPREAVEKGVAAYNDRTKRGNYWTAHAWFLKAGANGDAYYYLAELYRQGLGVKRNFDVAMDYSQRAVKNNSALAPRQLAQFYEAGEAVMRDPITALQMYEEGARRGDAQASYQAGYYLAYGTNTKQNFFEAISYLQRAVELAQAQNDTSLATTARQVLDETKDMAAAFADAHRPPPARCQKIAAGMSANGALLFVCE